MREIVTLQLWEDGAIAVNLEAPFRLVSGNFSPIYVNCRRLISSSVFIDLFCSCLRMLKQDVGLAFDAVAGGETAGIPFAAFAARSFGAPMLYVRKSPKEHGAGSQVEGFMASSARVLLIEDLITDAGSKVRFVHGLRNAGYVVEDIVVVFDRQQGGQELLEREGIRLHAIASMDDALGAAQASGFLTTPELSSVKAYLSSPASWHASMGLEYSA